MKGKYKKGIFVSEINPERGISSSIFGVENIERKKTRTDSPYLDLVLFDKTGSIRGKIWDSPERSIIDIYERLSRACLIDIDAAVQLYNDNLQVVITRIGFISPDRDDPIFKEILRATAYDIDDLWNSVLKMISEAENEDIKALLNTIAGDDKIKEAICSKPAAAKIHHAFLGGLLEHIYNLLSLVISIRASGIYKGINWDIMIAGAFLHDIGKIFEFSQDNLVGSHHYSKVGLMFGHIFIGASLVDKYIKSIEGFNEHIRLELIHIILSHHGRLEWGSPVEMKTKEAILLHYIDHLDAQMAHCLETLEKSADMKVDFTEKHLSSLGRQFYKSKL